MDRRKIVGRIGLQRKVYHICYLLVGPFVRRIYHFEAKPCRLKSRTFLALGNHTQNLDPALMVIGLRSHMRFVATDSLTRGVAGFFLNNLFGLIPREKGAKGDAVIRLIEENLKEGISVGMFPEGNRSWDGETEFISRRTARLAKESGVSLVTYRFTGGYLLRPRWAATRRKGPMRGELVNEYTPEQLAAMTEEEVYAAICRDLYVNAYEEQARHGDKYVGKKLAEGLQYAAYLCPSCHRFGSVRTEGNSISCECGMNTVYNSEGRFEGGNIPFSNLMEWNRFQKQWTHDNASVLAKSTSEPIFGDGGFNLSVVEGKTVVETSPDAEVSMYGDRIEIMFGGTRIVRKISEITGFGTALSASMYFNCGTTRYRLVATRRVSTLKYYAVWRALSGREYR